MWGPRTGMKNRADREQDWLTSSGRASEHIGSGQRETKANEEDYNEKAAAKATEKDYLLEDESNYEFEIIQ